MEQMFVARSVAGAERDLTKDARGQAFWDEHAAFIDELVAAGFTRLGGPFTDVGGAMLVVQAAGEAEVQARLAPDPWYANGILTLADVTRWEVFIDRWG